MSHDPNRHPNETLNEDTPLVDRAVGAVHEDTPDAESVRLAADRVWGNLAAEAARAEPAAEAGTDADVGVLDTCGDYQALLPAYMAGSLSEPRRILLEDHSRECVACRRALIAARKGETEEPAAAPAARSTSTVRRWLPLAAAAVVMFTVASLGFLVWDGWPGGGMVATVATIDGSLMAVDDGDGHAAAMAALTGGAEIAANAPVRTAKGSSAIVELTDGSRVELAERTQVRVRERRSGTTVYVDRGSIIVEAAQQTGPRHLYVSTDEARVQVTGTIFAVQHGVRGSRVSVVEGEVRVRQGSEETVLHPGMQVTSRSSLAEVSIEEEISWSRNFDRYVGLLAELTTLRDEIARRVEPAEIRFASDLAPRVPVDTMIYVALPNVSGELAQSYQVFKDRLDASPVLAEWWQSGSAEERENLDRAIGHLRDFGSYLGPEVVVALANDAGDSGDRPEPDAPLILATVERPDSFRAYLEQELERLSAEHGEALSDLVLVDDLADLPASGGDSLLVWLGDGLLVASPNPDRLRAAAAGNGGFPATELGETVARAYADGTQWLLAADLEPIFTAEAESDPELTETGFDRIRRLVVEGRADGERTVMSAELSFDGPRRGIASWLAAPAPMGSLEFISSDAHMASAFVVKEPAAMLDDLAAMMAAEGEGFGELEAELGLSVREDFAAPLGGELAFALDGPFLPKPSWKVIVEVYDPATLQHTLETAVAEANLRLAAEGQPTMEIGSETAGGVTFHRVTAGRLEQEFYWLYEDGYMVMAPSRALLERTLAQRDAGSTLTSSERFRSLLPRDGQADFSAVFFQHLAPLLAPLADGLSQIDGGELTAEQRATLAELLDNAEPSLVYAYGGESSITVAGAGPGGPLGMGMSAITGLGGLATLGQTMSAAAGEIPAEGAE